MNVNRSIIGVFKDKKAYLYWFKKKKIKDKSFINMGCVGVHLDHEYVEVLKQLDKSVKGSTIR